MTSGKTLDGVQRTQQTTTTIYITTMQLQLHNNRDPDSHLLLGEILHKFTIDQLIYNEFFLISQFSVSFQADATISSTMLPSDKEDVTTFHDSKETEVVSPSQHVTPLTTTMHNIMNHDIRSFLARPAIVLDGNIGAATPVGVVSSGRIANFIHSRPMYLDKLKGVYSLRYTTILHLKINATRFQAGCLMLCWVPTGGSLDAEHAVRLPINFSNRNQYTQTMHVKADFAYDSAVTLRIPFISDRYSCTYTSDPAGNTGNWALYLYSPLNFLTGSNVVPYTLYMSFEDVEMFGAVVPQSNMAIGGSKKKKRDHLSKEMSDTGPVSSALSMAATISTAISSVPLFAPIAAPAAYVFSALSGIASIFGWSNPRMIQKVERRTIQDFPFSCNYDSGNLSMPLGLSVSSHLGVVNGFAGSSVDEMSVDFIKKRYGHFASVTWTTAQADGTILYTFDVNPNALFVNSTTAAAISMLPLGYLGRVAQKYTGGFKFKIHIFKTPFHSGRLALVVSPIAGYSPVTTTLANMEFLSKAVVDITDYNIFEVTIPWLATETWLPTTTSMARFQIIVLDQLIAPGDVGTSVAMEIEVCGADDFQIAGMSNNALQPAVAQSGLDLDCDTLHVNIGESSVLPITYMKNSDCIGETFVSLKNITNTYRATNVEYNLTEILGLFIKPYAFNYKTAAAVTIGSREYISAIATLYGLFRGSMNISIYTDSTVEHTIVTAMQAPSANTALASTFVNNRAGILGNLATRQALSFKGRTTAAHVNVPYYSETPSSSVSDYLYSLNPIGSNATDLSNNISVGVLVNAVTATVIRTSLFRGGGDDFQLGLFMSIPIMIIS